MSDHEQTQPIEEQKNEAQFYLGDKDILTQLFEVVLYDVTRRSKMVASNELKREEAIAMDKQSAAFLAAVLAGKNEQFIAKPHWTGDPLAGYLKLYMKERFEKVGVTEEDLKDTRDILQAVAFEYICDVYQLMKVVANHLDTMNFQIEGKRLCVMWAERVLGLRESDPVLFEE